LLQIFITFRKHEAFYSTVEANDKQPENNEDANQKQQPEPDVEAENVAANEIKKLNDSISELTVCLT